MKKEYLCEFIGTAVLVLFGCGSAAIAGSTLGTLGIAFAFGLSIIAMAYVIGNVSGCHINPAVSLSMFMTGKMNGKDFGFYVLAQFLGGLFGALLLFATITACGLDVVVTGLGANGYGVLSANNINAFGAFVVETILTFVFIFTILGVTSDESKSSLSGIVIGLTLTFVHIMGIPLTGTSVNPARSFGPAFLLGTNNPALSQVWVFIIAPLFGAALASVVYMLVVKQKKASK